MLTIPGVITVFQTTTRARRSRWGSWSATCGFPDTTVWFEVVPERDIDVRMVVTADDVAPSLAVWRSIGDGLLAEEACRSSAEAGDATHLRLLAGENYLVQIGNTRGASITLELGPGPRATSMATASATSSWVRRVSQSTVPPTQER